MRTKITYGELIKKLLKKGFIEKRMKGSHIILFNKNFNSTIVLPSYRKNKIVEHYIIMTVKKNLVGKGIVNEEEFKNIINAKE